MAVRLINLDALTITDGAVLTVADLGINGTIQPTSGNRWTWHAPTHEVRRTLDSVGGNYLRDDHAITDVKVAQLRWFYWPGSAPTLIEYPASIRSSDPLDGQRVGVAVDTSGNLRLTYNSAVLGATIYNMSALPAGMYAVEYQANCLTSGGSVKGWLYSEDLATVIGTATATGIAFTASTAFGRFRYGGAAAGGAWTVDRLAHGLVSAVGEPLTDNMLKTAWLATLVLPPTLTVTRPAENLVDARTSAAGSGGTLTFAMTHISGPDHTAGIAELVEGLFVVPRDPSAASTYSVTATEAPSGMTATTTAVVAPLAAVVDTLRRRVWTGTAWA